MSGGRNTRTQTRMGSTAQQLAQNEEREEEPEERSASDGEGGVWEVQGGKSKKVRQKYVCGGGKKACGIMISDGEDSVRCDLCEEWFHPKCQGLTIEAFRALTKYDFIWMCMGCKPNFMNVLKLEKKMESKLDTVQKSIMDALEMSHKKPEESKNLEDKLKEMEKAVMNRMNEQKVEVEKSLNAQKEVVLAMPKLQSELEKSAQELKKIVEKNDDKEMRQMNIIVHNIPESKSGDPSIRKKYDIDSFENIVCALFGEEKTMEIDKIYRLGKKRDVGAHDESEPKPRLMLVGLKKREDVDMLMSRRWELRNVGFSNIYLTRDMSPEVRKEQRKLREELKEKGQSTHRIFRGKVVLRH